MKGAQLALLFFIALIATAAVPLLIAVAERIRAEAGFKRSAARAQEEITGHLWHPLGSQIKAGG